jgi:hypothetical protein
MVYVRAGTDRLRRSRDERGSIRHGLVQGGFVSLPVFLVALDRHTDRLGENGRYDSRVAAAAFGPRGLRAT